MTAPELKKELYEILKTANLNKEFDAVIRSLREAFEVRASFNGPYPEGWNIFECLNDWISDECHPRARIGQIILKKYLAKLDHPWPFSSSEIHDVLGDQLVILKPLTEWPPVIDLFKPLIDSIEELKTEPIPFFIDNGSWKVQTENLIIWENRICRIEICTASSLSTQNAKDTIHAIARSLGTQNTITTLEQTLTPLLPLLVHLFRRNICSGTNFMIAITQSEFIELLPLIQSSLNIFFPTKQRLNSTQSKLRNALLLLVEASTQQNDSISAAMSFAAIDAILGDKDQPVGQNILTLCARILESKPEFRSKAKQKIKSIYNIRNLVFHAGDMSYFENDRYEAFLLASSLFSAVLQALETRKRVEEKDAISLTALLQDVRDNEYSSGLIDGVIETDAVRLWRKDHNDI